MLRKLVLAPLLVISFLAGLLPVFLTDDLSNRFKIIGPSHLENLAYAFLITLAIYILLRIADFFSKFLETRPIPLRMAFPAIHVDAAAVRFLDRQGILHLPPCAGSAIETFSHPFIDKRLDDNGWSIDEVKITSKGGVFPVNRKLRSEEVIRGENGAKYALVGVEHPYADSSTRLDLQVQATDWYTVLRARTFIRRDEALRHSLGSLVPAANKVPSILCLHFVCLTLDDYFLTLKRLPDTPFAPNAMSISFEEQYAKVDHTFEPDKRMHAWFVRAICEEVLPLAGLVERDFYLAAEEVKKNVAYMRIWTGIYEEDNAGHSLFGVMKLNQNIGEVRQLFQELYDKYNTRHDREGDMFYMHRDQVEALILSGHATCKPLLKEQPERPVNDLHPTALYRAAQVLKCL